MTITHKPLTIEDACLDELAHRCGEAARLCRWLTLYDPVSGEVVSPPPAGAVHACDVLTARWVTQEAEHCRRVCVALPAPVNPRLVGVDR